MITLAHDGYRLLADPLHGGAIRALEWTRANGQTLPLLEPLIDLSIGFKAGCFAMVPFANRIDHGRFSFAGRDIHLPINLPGEDMAIHGFARDNAWQMVQHDAGNLMLAQDFSRPDNPYRYHAVQEITLADGAVRIAMSIRNTGEETLPFGLGLHPWFPKTPMAMLAFHADGALGRDARGLPVGPPAPVASFNPQNPTPLGRMDWLDGCFTGWQPRAATIIWPERDTCLLLTADGAFTHLHVYVPDQRAVFCAEPVSHAPDAVNRPELGPGCAMTALEPGQSLAGSMTFTAFPLRQKNEGQQ